MRINQAKFVGIIALEEPLEEDKSYSIALEQCEVKRIETKKNAEDEKEYVNYILENIGRCNILTEKEGKAHLIKAKAKKCTQSQLLRLQIEADGLDYEKTMAVIISRWKELI